ncbi:MAG: HAD family hydrolase [Promethearchaeota archaeon]|nr:MAG: HAD family hydrolase [Candidatus Lokiarchaeota archaeon]
MSLRNHIKAILFDLDGTLIDVDLKKFIPEYLSLLASNVSHLVRSSKVISKLMIASQLIDKNDGSKTNEQVFNETFFSSIGYTREEMNPYIDKFYEKDFPKLRQYTRQKPAARKVIETAFEKGYDVVIATTPLLPETAIRQRLDWAGVSPEEFPYKLITSIENTSANKPNLLYYKSIAQTIGRSTQECLMVGDEDKDMVAAKLGMKTFLVQSVNTQLELDTPKPDYQGTLIDLEKML